jgi:hypothetical protein
MVINGMGNENKMSGNCKKLNEMTIMEAFTVVIPSKPIYNLRG